MRKIVNTKKMVDDLLSKPLKDPTTYELKLIASKLFEDHKEERYGVESCKQDIIQMWEDYQLKPWLYYEKLNTAVSAAKRKPEALIEATNITFSKEEIEWFKNFKPWTGYDKIPSYKPANIKKYIPAQIKVLWTLYCWYKIQLQYRNEKGAMKFDYIEDEVLLQKSAQVTTKVKIGAIAGLEKAHLIGCITSNDPDIQRLFMKEEWVQALQKRDKDNPDVNEVIDYMYSNASQSASIFVKDVPVGEEIVFEVAPDELVGNCWKYWQIITGQIKQVKCRVCGKVMERTSNNTINPICDECRKKLKAEKERERYQKKKIILPFSG